MGRLYARSAQRPLLPGILDEVARAEAAAERFTPAQVEHAAELVVERYMAMPHERRAFYATPESAMLACCEELVVQGALDELRAEVALPAAIEYVKGRDAT